jgi:CheY-like chemotaxis protein
MRILLVEDDEVCREIVEVTLRKHGHEVVSVATGPEAVAVFDTGERPDLLLTDIQLPGELDGWDLAHLLQDEVPELPVIYITGSRSDAEPVSNSIYLRKPVRPQLLLQAVAAIGSTTVTSDRRYGQRHS